MSPAVHTRRSATIALVLVVLAAWTVGCQSEAKENAVPIHWDDSRRTAPDDTPPEVEIPSSMDGTKQKALFRASTRTEAAPLIVSLHTWSGNYRQHDPLAAQCLALNWNYIRPDFRGPNHTPQACGSPQVISDIDDAIAYALDQAPVAPSEIHVIGKSGGGHAALVMYLSSRHPVTSFSAWVPITDLVSWYHESVGRSRKYAWDILAATSSDKDDLDEAEAKRRSPLHMPLQSNLPGKRKLHLRAGIHDGHTGSVPVTHSLHFYNRVVRKNGGDEPDLVSTNDMFTLAVARTFPHAEADRYLGGRKIHYFRSYKNVELTIFEGGHEMLVPVALDHIDGWGSGEQTRTIVTVGDSNGASEHGWVAQLRKLRPQDLIINKSISGNTVGFDNRGQKRKNTLRNINQYLHSSEIQAGGRRIDEVIINLGTNDCKAVFDDRISEIPKHMSRLIEMIRDFSYASSSAPRITIVSPPPYGPDSVLKEKYHGGDGRVRRLIPGLKTVADKHGIAFVNIYDTLKPDYTELSPDGVHMEAAGQKRIARQISAQLDSTLVKDSDAQ